MTICGESEIQFPTLARKKLLILTIGEHSPSPHPLPLLATANTRRRNFEIPQFTA